MARACFIAALACGFFGFTSIPAVDAGPVTQADLAFLTMLKHAVSQNRLDIIADHIAYPVETFFGTGKCKYRNKKEFIRNYRYIFNKSIIKEVELQAISRKYVRKFHDEDEGNDYIEVGEKGNRGLFVEVYETKSHKVAAHKIKNSIQSASPYHLSISPDEAAQKALLEHPSAAAGARLQALDAELAATCPPAPPAPPPPPDEAASADESDPYPVTPADIAFLKMLKQAVARNRPDIIARHIIYPLRVNFSDRSCYIQTPARFLRDYAAIFNADIRKVFADQSLDPKQIFANDEGFMIGDGDVWMATLSADSGKTFADYVTAINADSIASDRALHAPSAATGAHLQAILEPLRKICPAGQRR